jgi:hypothetical protein
MPTKTKPNPGRPKAPRGYKYRSAQITVTARDEERRSVERCARAHGISMVEALLMAHREHMAREHHRKEKEVAS